MLRAVLLVPHASLMKSCMRLYGQTSQAAMPCSRASHRLGCCCRQVWDVSRHLQRPSDCSTAQLLAWQLCCRHLQLQQHEQGQPMQLPQGQMAWLLQGDTLRLKSLPCTLTACPYQRWQAAGNRIGPLA
jgi:hypothetical protein